MELTPIYKRVIALDVHQAKITACAIVEHDDGRQEMTKLDFGAFKRDRRALAQWALQIRPEVVVMESTGVYWKSPFAALETVGIIAWVVNARHVKAVPGRKTDMADAQWLATLARAGLLRGSFIPPVDLRQLRLVARQRQKLMGMLSAEKNRLHKVLVDAGIRINVLVSDVHGQSARAMIKALIKGQPMHLILNLKGRLGASREELFEALSTEQFSARHAFVADEIMQHIEYIEQRVARMDGYLLSGLAAWQPQLNLLQTIPLLGGRLPGQQRERRQAQDRAHPQRQRLGAQAAVRVRAGRSPNPMRPEGQVRLAGHPQGTQEVRHRPGPQDAAHHLRHAQQRHPLRGQDRRLRSDERGQKCAALDQDAQEARLHRPDRSGLIPAANRPDLSPGRLQARPRRALTAMSSTLTLTVDKGRRLQRAVEQDLDGTLKTPPFVDG